MANLFPTQELRPETEAVRTNAGMLKNPEHQPEDVSRPPVCLRFTLSDGTKLDVASRSYIMLGRKDEGNSQQIDIDFAQLGGRENGVSRCHAIIRVTNSSVLIKDFNSRNGTFLNGYELHPMREYMLKDGDEIVLGRIRAGLKFIYG
jgi:pSer/pThr/pTyr-binding forkhead associated (FHA) protein